MNKFYFGEDGKGKLVRDKLADVISAEGHEVDSVKLNKSDLALAIVNKILEEQSELLQAVESKDQNDIKFEIADILTLVESLAKVCGIEMKDIDNAKFEKASKKGGFVEGVQINSVTLSPNSEGYEFWLKHFRENSGRYIEEKSE